LALVNAVQEIKTVLPKLAHAEIEEVRAWIDDFLESQMELKDDIKAKLDQSRREITIGRFYEHGTGKFREPADRNVGAT